MSDNPLGFQSDEVEGFTREIADPTPTEPRLEHAADATDIPFGGPAKENGDGDEADDDYDGNRSQFAKQQRLLPYAPSTLKYFEPEGTLKFRPRPEWWHNTKDYDPSSFEDQENILDAAIRQNSTEAALALIKMISESVLKESLNGTSNKLSSSTEFRDISPMLIGSNQDGITPLILASQKGNFPVVKALLQQPLVDPVAATPGGTTALIEAARFGHVDIMNLLLQSVEYIGPLVEAKDNDGNTALMYAAQEGHLRSVDCLLRHRAAVNRENNVPLSALMLAAHRGHAAVCQRLLRASADVDQMVLQGVTALTLACQRGHVAIVKILVAAGCALDIPDNGGRFGGHWRHHTRLEEILRRRWRLDGDDEIVSLSPDTEQALHELLDPIVQVYLMKQSAHIERNWEMVRMRTLLQQHRARVCIPRPYPALQEMVDLEAMVDLYNQPSPSFLPPSMISSSTQALIRTMTLPEAVVQMIASFLPTPMLWMERIEMLRSTASVNANEGLVNTLDFMDEVLEVGGFLTACDTAHVPAPLPHTSWSEWKSSAALVPQYIPRHMYRNHILEAMPPSPQDPTHPTIHELRRQVGYLPLLAQYQFHSNLLDVLTSPPYRMPLDLLQKLIRMADIASIVRRCKGRVYFETNDVMEIIQLASWLCTWYSNDRNVN